MADMYEALTAHRPYRHSLSLREALDILTGESRASRLDPEAVEALRRLLAHQGDALVGTKLIGT